MVLQSTTGVKNISSCTSCSDGQTIRHKRLDSPCAGGVWYGAVRFGAIFFAEPYRTATHHIVVLSKQKSAPNRTVGPWSSPKSSNLLRCGCGAARLLPPLPNRTALYEHQKTKSATPRTVVGFRKYEKTRRSSMLHREKLFRLSLVGLSALVAYVLVFVPVLAWRARVDGREPVSPDTAPVLFELRVRTEDLAILCRRR